MIKKILTFVVTIAITLSMCANFTIGVNAQSEETMRYGQLKYAMKKGYGLTITGGDPDIKDLVIPSYINGNKVSYIDNMAFYESNIETLYIKEGLTYFGNNCFQKSYKLKSCDLPKSLKSIMYGGFANCPNLESVVIRNPKCKIGEFAFYGCNNLEDIYFAGTESQWKDTLWYSTSKNDLSGVTIHYNYKGEPPKQISVYLNGDIIEFDVLPTTENNRTLVPVRAIFEAMGMNVAWDNSTSTVTATGNGNSITMKINQTTAKVNGKLFSMDVPARMIGERTLVPVRFIAESLGADVDWNEEDKIVYIKYN